MGRRAPWMAVLALAVVSSVRCGKSPEELCRDAAQGFCHKVFECVEGEPRRAMEGGTFEGCMASHAATCPADPCDRGMTYHADKAEECVAAWRTMTCGAFGMNPNVAVCDLICTP